MINKIMNIKEDDPMYKVLTKELDNVSDDSLVIVARSYKNRKNDQIQPIEIKNGIYFYVGYDLSNKTAFLGNVTPPQIKKAKENMMKRARIGTMREILITGGVDVDEFRPTAYPMNIVTLDCGMYGAGMLYCEDFLRRMENKIGKYYIIPSSIHELIFVPVDVMGIDDLTDMVLEVNQTVDDNDFLADKAFEISDWN